MVGSSLHTHALLAALLVLVSLPGEAAAQLRPGRGPLFGNPVNRDGVHLQVGFGVGAGPNLLGLHHTMEIGATFAGGITVAVLHTFIQNRHIGQSYGGPDLIGAWLLELKAPFGFPELVAKVAFGLGGEHDQSDGIRLIPGVGWAYGVDLHLPVDPRHGATIGLTVLHTYAEGRHSVGVGLALGWTVF